MYEIKVKWLFRAVWQFLFILFLFFLELPNVHFERFFRHSTQGKGMTEIQIYFCNMIKGLNQSKFCVIDI